MKKKVLLTTAFIIIIFNIGCSQTSNETIYKNIKEVTFESRILQKDMKILIWLPNDYAANKEKYPVHYLVGGEDRFLYYGGVVNYFSLAGDFPPTIIVRAISNPLFNYGNLKNADKYIDYLQDELIPYIDSSYRTTSFRSLWGQSNSAAFTFYSFIKKPDLFTAYFMNAPYGLKHFQQSEIDSIDKKIRHSKYLYISFGKEDRKKQVDQFINFQKMINTIQLKKLSFKFALLDHENHQSILLRNIPDGLRSFYSGISYGIKDYKTLSIDSIEKHYSDLSQKYGCSIKIPEGKLISLGFELQLQKNYEKAKEVFLLCIKLYPDTNSDKYNLLGHVYECLGNIKKAIFYYKKDLEIHSDNEWTKNKLHELQSK